MDPANERFRGTKAPYYELKYNKGDPYLSASPCYTFNVAVLHSTATIQHDSLVSQKV